MLQSRISSSGAEGYRTYGVADHALGQLASMAGDVHYGRIYLDDSV